MSSRVDSYFCLQISVGGEAPPDTSPGGESPYVIDATDAKHLRRTVATVVEKLRIESGWDLDDLRTAILGYLQPGRSVRLHVKNFDKLIEQDATRWRRWKRLIEDTAKEGTRWSGEMPLRAYLEASAKTEWEQRLPAGTRVRFYDLWPGSSCCHSNVIEWEQKIAGCHAGVVQFVRDNGLKLRSMKDYESKTPHEIIGALSNGQDKTVFDRIWDDLDVSHQDMARKLVLNPQLLPPEDWRLGPFNFGRPVNGTWRWFSPLFRDYLYYYHTTRGALFRITRLRKICDGIVYLLRNTVRDCWQEHNILVRSVGALVCSIGACWLSLHGHPWRVFLPLILGIMLIRPLVRPILLGSGLAKATVGRLRFLLLVFSILCAISLLPVMSYWFGERVSKMASPPQGFWMAVAYPYWVSPGDTIEVNIHLDCASHCPKSTGIRLRSPHPDVEFAAGESVWEKQLPQKEWGSDGQMHVPAVMHFAWQYSLQAERRNLVALDRTAPCPLNSSGKLAQVPIEISMSPSGQEPYLYTHVVCLDVIPTTVPYVGPWLDDLPALYAKLLGMLRGTDEVPAPWALHERLGGAIPVLAQALAELALAEVIRRVSAAVWGIRSS